MGDIERIQKMMKETEKNLSKVPQLKQLKKATGLQITWMLLGAAVLAVFLVYIFSGLRALATLVGVVYPAWCSLKAIKSTDKEDDTFWLPFYELLKIVFYLFLFSPQFKGALTIYYALLEPLVSKLVTYEKSAVNAAKGVRDSIIKG